MNPRRQRLLLVAWLAVPLALGAVPAAAQKSPLAQAARSRAEQHLDAGRFLQAASEIEAAVRYEPRFALGWYLLGSANRRAGRCDQAVFAYRRYMELRPAAPDPHFGAGLCLQAIGDNEGASASFRQYLALEIRPASAEFVAVARKQLAALERQAAAAAGLATTAPAPPADLARRIAEAREHRQRGRSEAAITAYRAAVAADARSSEASSELGAMLIAAHQPAEAVAVLRTTVRLSPALAPAWYDLAFALRETGNAEDAVKAYWRYITLRPKDPDPHYGLGRALVSLGRDGEALAAWRRYVVLETRPTERQWVKKARAEIARIESSEREPASVTARATAPATDSGANRSSSAADSAAKRSSEGASRPLSPPSFSPISPGPKTEH